MQRFKKKTAFYCYSRKFGYKWWSEEKCPDEATRKAHREALFKEIDANNDGGISFDEWLDHALKHYKYVSLF